MEIILALIVAAGSIFVAVLNNGANLLVKHKYENKDGNSKLELQLLEVFTPIHKIMTAKRCLINKEDIDEIGRIINKQYVLVSPEIFKGFQNLQQKIKGLEDDECSSELGIEADPFFKLIDNSYKIARSKLGYTKVRYKEKDASITKNFGVGKRSYLTHVRVCVDLCVAVILLFRVYSFIINYPGSEEYITRPEIIITSTETEIDTYLDGKSVVTINSPYNSPSYVIYYTVDDTHPEYSLEAKIYEGPFVVNNSDYFIITAQILYDDDTWGAVNIVSRTQQMSRILESSGQRGGWETQ